MNFIKNTTRHANLFFLLVIIFYLLIIKNYAYGQEVTLKKVQKKSHGVKNKDIKNDSLASCSDVKKSTKYKVQKGDHIAAILRTLQLEPVFGKNNSLEKLLKINSLPNPDLIEPNQELAVPFDCEEQVVVWQTTDRISDRLLNRKKDNFITINNKEIKPGSNIDTKIITTIESISEVLPVKTEGEQKIKNAELVTNTTDHIIDKNTPIEEINHKNIDNLTETTNQDVSEALRYRMICDGEWTGTQCVTRYSILFATLSGWYNRYDGTDPSVTTNNHGILLSKLNPEGGIGWNNYWTENFKTELFASMENVQILPEAREIPIEQSKKYLGSFQLGARYESGPWGFGVGFRQFDKLFYRFRFSGLSQPCFSSDSSFAGCGIFVHTASVSALSANLSYMIYQAGKFRYDAKVEFISLGPASTAGFTIANGTGYSANFRVTHDRVKEYLFGDITYSQASQNTSIEVQKVAELGFTFGYAWKLKDW